MALFGEKNVSKRPEVREKIRNALKGRPKSEEHKNNIQNKFQKGHKTNLGKHWKLSKKDRNAKCLRRGELSGNWKGGITPLNQQIRGSLEYKFWRKAVFERDDYTCIWCGKRGGRLEADHIKPFALYPELRFAIDNGRTLCFECHRTKGHHKEKIKEWKAKRTAA